MSFFAGNPGRPLNISAHKQDERSMELKWTHPHFSGGVPIDRYDITVSPAPHDGVCRGGNCNVSGTNITLKGLACLSYNITIRANNCAGQSSFISLLTTSKIYCHE